jgi:hypothetical protein
MPNTGSALDRLGRLMHGEDIEEVDTSISSKDYMDDLEDDIMSKMHIEEVSLDTEEFPESAGSEETVNEESELESEDVSDEDDDQTVFSEPVKEEPNNTETTPEGEISIDVTDVGEEVSYDLPSNEGLFNNNIDANQPKPEKRKYCKRKQKEESNMSVDKTVATKNTDSNPLYDQLVISMIDELRKKKFKFNGFNEKSMEVLYNYVLSKI